MKTNLTHLLALVALTLASCSQPTEDGLTVTANFDNARPLNKAVYGVNNELVGCAYRVDNPSFIANVKELGLQGFRYPAGTYANFLDLKSGLGKAWEGINDKNIARLDNIVNSFERRGFGLDYNSLITLNKETDVTTSFILNISSSTFEDNIAALRDMKAQGAELTNIEFGNELYYDAYSSAVASPEAYVEIAKRYIPAIREIFPAAKFSASLQAPYYSNESFLDEPTNGDKRMVQWYRCMEQNQDVFDALAIHFYSNIGMGDKVKKADFIPFEEAYKHTISHSDKRFASTMKRLKQDFPDLELWITEYHVGGFMNDVRQYRLRYSYVGALFCADFMLKLLSAPQVTLSSWHAFQQWFAVEGSGDDAILTPQNANYSLFKAFRDPVLNSNQYVAVSIDSCAMYKGAGYNPGRFPEVEGGVFYNDQSGEGYLVLINKLASDYQLSARALRKSLGGRVVSATEYRPDVTLDFTSALRDELGAITIADVESQGGYYAVAPYSLNVYKFKR